MNIDVLLFFLLPTVAIMSAVLVMARDKRALTNPRSHHR
jgi:hypothetical protein